MKLSESFLKLIRLLPMKLIRARPQKTAGHHDIFFIIKSSVIHFAAIIIPCLLQLPLVAFGQDGADGVDSGLVDFEIVGESIQFDGVVAKRGNTVRESGFVGMHSISQSQIPLQRKSASDPDKRDHDGDKHVSVFSKYLDHWWIGFIGWIPLLPFLFYAQRIG
jgi:hypothetical protein